MKVLMMHIVDQDFKYADQLPSEASIHKKRKNKCIMIVITMKTMKSSEGKIVSANESSDNETQLSEDEIPDAPKNHQSTDQKLVEILSDELAISMRQFRPLGYTDRIRITRDILKFRYRGKCPIASPGPKSPIEKNEQFADALCAITDAYQTLLVTIQESIEMRPNQEQCAHAYKMISIAAQAVAKIREDSNALPSFKAVLIIVDINATSKLRLSSALILRLSIKTNDPIKSQPKAQSTTSNQEREDKVQENPLG
ncbi:MAG: hypothetical protein EZS28_022332 [Streblomastix strix]|uniref:Uncharacterized protein n=1 Tax=Streblomastix strix TaxID=222440 RepID=A0A5J4VIG1_9EUKA|nr:MAG: hypothetical protein EZS28_022332 [Streblomastix strix]